MHAMMKPPEKRKSSIALDQATRVLAERLPKFDYIHDNPVKRGYVDDPVHWRYSSARDYAGQPGLVKVITDWR